MLIYKIISIIIGLCLLISIPIYLTFIKDYNRSSNALMFGKQEISTKFIVKLIISAVVIASLPFIISIWIS